MFTGYYINIEVISQGIENITLTLLAFKQDNKIINRQCTDDVHLSFM